MRPEPGGRFGGGPTSVLVRGRSRRRLFARLACALAAAVHPRLSDRPGCGCAAAGAGSA